MNFQSPYSTLLFDRPSFVEGMARVLDFSGSLNEYAESLSPEEADAAALASDWRAIGADLWGAVEELTEETGDAPVRR